MVRHKPFQANAGCSLLTEIIFLLLRVATLSISTVSRSASMQSNNAHVFPNSSSYYALVGWKLNEFCTVGWYSLLRGLKASGVHRWVT